MKALNLLGRNCNKYANGVCQTVACLPHDSLGKLVKPIDFSKATCEYSEAIEELEKIWSENQVLKFKMEKLSH